MHTTYTCRFTYKYAYLGATSFGGSEVEELAALGAEHLAGAREREGGAA
eukprot:CAMPEP_0202107350 /NCGR_PEP_ID=MMETSP0965-20130614/15947_1 /ASSEMBLY_ACC=CAM_ASM_000507 /TAXON_ID=4773 /ORGANISM="Schizochytrium aggregatum, Strain ATCC28209" /LENGTH=48 /DNA_ID= /DNA_START= /DNA_END= /DNA_ORIENTATION=